MHITNQFKIPRGHENIDFIDVNVLKDTTLFIDPCLIETINDEFCNKAQEVMYSFFDSFYSLYKNHALYDEKHDFFDHAHEINATKLGYGNGKNGKAKTADGMIATFSGLQGLIDKNIPISKAIDLPIFIEGFAEDCMSDLLTNALFKCLNEFTLEQCSNYNFTPRNFDKTFYYWDIVEHNWKEYKGKYLLIQNEVILLVPKYLVRKSYYYNLEQYFRSIILGKRQLDKTTYDEKGKEYKPTKTKLREDLLKNNSDILRVSVMDTISNPELLEQHHSKLISSYRNRGMADVDLNAIVYK